jgi:Family of unknown function (DUF6069)
MTDHPGDPAPAGTASRLTYRSRPDIQVDLLRYWSAMPVVAAIASFAGIIVLRMAGDVFDTPLFVPERAGSDVLVPLSDSKVIWTCVIVTAAAAGVLNLMLYLIPRPEWFYSVLSVVVLGASLLWPFSLDIESRGQAWLIALQVVVGVIILSLTLIVAGSVSRTAPPPYRPPAPGYASSLPPPPPRPAPPPSAPPPSSPPPSSPAQ